MKPISLSNFSWKFAIKSCLIIFCIILFSCKIDINNTYAATYSDAGVLTSTNLLPVAGASLINSFGYTVSIPTGTSIKIQFAYSSADVGGQTWCNSIAVCDGSAWTTLTDGTNNIDLSSLGLQKAYFFYRVWLLSDGTSTPVLSSVSLRFNSFDGTFYNYSSSGTLTSSNLIPVNPDGGVSSINSFTYSVSSLPPNTGISVQFSQDGNSWYNGSGLSNSSTTLSVGTSTINLSGLGWSLSQFYYRATLTSSDGLQTPILNSISLNYISNNYYWVGSEGGNWNNSANWSATSGGAGGIGVPSGSDTAIFDEGNTHSAIIDTPVTVTAIMIKTGYTGTITQTTGSVITTSGTLTQNAGTAVISESNIINGGVILNGGTLDINKADALGTSTFTISGGTIDNTSGSSITLTKGNTQNWNGNFTFTGTNNLNFGTTSTITLSTTTTVTVSSTTSNLTIGSSIVGAYSLNKSGNGALTLNGNNSYVGGMTVIGGSFNLSTSTSYFGNYTQNGGSLNVYGSSTITGNFIINAGTADFHNGSILNGSMNVANGLTVGFHDTSHNTGTITGKGVFNDTSYNSGIVNGDANFAFIIAGTATIQGGIVYGTVTGSVRGVSDNIPVTHWIFNSNSYNNGTTTVASSSVVDFYDTSYNTGNIIIQHGGIVNFHDSSRSTNGIFSVANGGILNFLDSSFNSAGTSTISAGGIMSFSNYSYNNGTVNGDVIFNDDSTQNIGTVNGSTTRKYNSDATTTRNFTTDGGHNDWILIAQGVVVDISHAVYSLVTNIFKALTGGFFTFGSNSSGGPVVPQIVVNSPLANATSTKWTPSISWGIATTSAVTCEYKLDGDTNYSALDCAMSGSDIPRPTATPHTLYLRATDQKGDISEKSIVFTYDNTVPIYTNCGDDLLDEVTRPYYYLEHNVIGNCTVTANNVELRGAMATSTTGGFSVSGNIIASGMNILLKNITVSGVISTNATTTGGHAGTITIENSSIATTTANGADGAPGINGGDGGDISIATSTTGSIFANGGDPEQNGGNAGRITVIYSYSAIGTTTIYARGGDSTGCGYGGSGGDVTLINSLGYEVINEKGADQTHACTPTSGSHGQSGSSQIVGVYHPPGWSPSIASATNGPATNTQSTGSTVVGPGGIFNILPPVPVIGPLNLNPLPTFGEADKGTVKNTFNFITKVNSFLFTPLTLTPNKNITAYLNSVGIEHDQDAVALRTTPVPIKKDIPGLFTVTTNLVPQKTPTGWKTNQASLTTYLASTKASPLTQTVTAFPGSILTLTFTPQTQGTPQATFNNQPVSFTTSGKTLTTTITLPTTPGSYIFSTPQSPLPLTITIPRPQITEQKQAPVPSFWSVLRNIF